MLSSSDKSQDPDVPANLLAFLERLSTFPTESSELNSWWVEEFGVRPPKPKTSGEEDEDESEEPAPQPAEDAEHDWRKYFEDEAPIAEQKKAHVRLHKLTIHQSLHSLGAHKAMFTRAWLSLLPHLSVGNEESKKALATRVLNVMHRGVMPHLTRAVLVMDWVGSYVDYGGSVGLLSLNALFILMKEYNLCVNSSNLERRFVPTDTLFPPETTPHSIPDCTLSSTETFFTSNTAPGFSA